MKIYDLTYPIETGMPVFPGDADTQVTQTTSVMNEGYCTYHIKATNHCGTHIDSPAHMLERGIRIQDLPLERCIGRGQILDCRQRIDGDGCIFYDTDLVRNVEEEDILFFFTGWSQYYGTDDYYHAHPILDQEWITFFQEKRIKIIGMDMPSPDYYPFPFHHTLFEAGIYMIENLAHLEQVRNLSAEARFMVVPLQWDLDGSWVRVWIQD